MAIYIVFPVELIILVQSIIFFTYTYCVVSKFKENRPIYIVISIIIALLIILSLNFISFPKFVFIVLGALAGYALTKKFKILTLIGYSLLMTILLIWK